MMTRRTFAVNASRRWSIGAVLCTAHAVEQVGLLALAVEPKLWAFTRRDRHRLTTCKLDLRTVRGERAHVPLEPIF
eukprot:COSAG02_NODE_4_length_69935_cov_46.806590_26_plen_76_part_00